MEPAWIGVLESTPLGPVWVAVSERGLVAVEIGEDDGGRRTDDGWVAGGRGSEAIVRVVRRLGFSQVIVDQERTGEARRQIAELFVGGTPGFRPAD